MKTNKKMQNLTSNGFFVAEMKDNHWFLMKKNIYDCLCRIECLLVFNTLLMEFIFKRNKKVICW